MRGAESTWTDYSHHMQEQFNAKAAALSTIVPWGNVRLKMEFFHRIISKYINPLTFFLSLWVLGAVGWCRSSSVALCYSAGTANSLPDSLIQYPCGTFKNVTTLSLQTYNTHWRSKESDHHFHFHSHRRLIKAITIHFHVLSLSLMLLWSAMTSWNDGFGPACMLLKVLAATATVNI